MKYWRYPYHKMCWVHKNYTTKKGPKIWNMVNVYSFVWNENCLKKKIERNRLPQVVHKLLLVTDHKISYLKDILYYSNLYNEQFKLNDVMLSHSRCSYWHSCKESFELAHQGSRVMGHHRLYRCRKHTAKIVLRAWLLFNKIMICRFLSRREIESE